MARKKDGTLPKPRTKLQHIVDGSNVFIDDPFVWRLSWRSYLQLLEKGYDHILVHDRGSYFLTSVMPSQVTVGRVLQRSGMIKYQFVSMPRDTLIDRIEHSSRTTNDVWGRLVDILPSIGFYTEGLITEEELNVIAPDIVHAYERLKALYDQAYPEPEEEVA